MSTPKRWGLTECETGGWILLADHERIVRELSANRACVPANFPPLEELRRLADEYAAACSRGDETWKEVRFQRLTDGIRYMLSAAPEPAGERVSVPVAWISGRSLDWLKLRSEKCHAEVSSVANDKRDIPLYTAPNINANERRYLAYRAKCHADVLDAHRMFPDDKHPPPTQEAWNADFDAQMDAAQPTAEPAPRAFSKVLELDKRHILFPVAILEIIRAELAQDLDVMEQAQGLYVSSIIEVIGNYLSAEPAVLRTLARQAIAALSSE